MGEFLHHRTFPEICNECLGVYLPDVSACDIQGWGLCLSMCDAKAFGPFLPEDTDIARCLDMASEFWENMIELRDNLLNLDTIQTAQGLSSLCPSCLWREDCSHFKGSSHPEWEDTLAQFMELKTRKKSIEAEIGELESRLKVAHQLSHTIKGEWINTGSHTFRVISQNGRVTLDRKRLNEELETLLGEQEAQILMARCEKQGDPFERLYATCLSASLQWLANSCPDTLYNKTEEMDMLEKIDDYKKKLDTFRPLGEELLPQIKAYYRVGLAYSSTALEGFSYTESETKILLEEGLTVGGKPLRDALAITGHAKAYDAMFSLLHEHVLTNDNILEMHALLENGLGNEIAGVYRKKQIFVTGTPFVFPKADTVLALMEAFECWMREYRRKIHPVEFAIKVHLKLVSIHPFEDGNGRIARLAMNTILLQEGYLPLVVPPLLRSEYITVIKKAQVSQFDGDYLHFMYRREIETQREMLRLLEGEGSHIPL